MQTQLFVDLNSSADFDVHATSTGLDKDMRFHVLGLGPVGQLFAFHLRRTISPKHAISLMFKNPQLAKRMHDNPIHIEYQGVVSSVSGFDTESTLAGVYDLQNRRKEIETDSALSKGSGDTLILPSRDARKAIEVPWGKEIMAGRGGEPIESLIVACKAQSTLAAIRQVEHRLSPESTIVLLQNGNLGVHQHLIQNIFTKEKRPNFILVSNTHGVWLKRSPFHVVHAGIGQMHFGIIPNGERDFEKTYYEGEENDDEQIRRRGGKAQLSLDDIARPADDAEIARYRSLRNTVAVLQGLTDLQALWVPFEKLEIVLRQKLVVNCVVNPLTAILGCQNGELYEDPAANRLTQRICHEAAEVFKRELVANAGPSTKRSEVNIPPELTAPKLVDECKRVARITAGNTSSMLADLKKGNKSTEIEFLNGYLLNLAKQYKCTIPVNATMVDLVKMRTTLPYDSL